MWRKGYIMKINSSEWKWHLLFAIIVLMLVYPLVFALLTSFKPMSEAFSSASLIPKDPTFSAMNGSLRQSVSGRFFQIPLSLPLS